jgi:hypothetical protein
MSASLNVNAYSSTESKEFQRHFKAVNFCIENNLSYPKETSEFFKGKVGGENLENIRTDHIIEYIKNGVEIPLKTTRDKYVNAIRIKVSEIPPEVDLIIVSLDY